MLTAIGFPELSKVIKQYPTNVKQDKFEKPKQKPTTTYIIAKLQKKKKKRIEKQ